MVLVCCVCLLSFFFSFILHYGALIYIHVHVYTCTCTCELHVHVCVCFSQNVNSRVVLAESIFNKVESVKR